MQRIRNVVRYLCLLEYLRDLLFRVFFASIAHLICLSILQINLPLASLSCFSGTQHIQRRSSARQKQALFNFTFKGNFLKVVVQGIVYIPWIYMLPKTYLPHVSCPTFQFPLQLASSLSALREFANISPIHRRRALWRACGG